MLDNEERVLVYRRISDIDPMPEGEIAHIPNQRMVVYRISKAQLERLEEYWKANRMGDYGRALSNGRKCYDRYGRRLVRGNSVEVLYVYDGESVASRGKRHEKRTLEPDLEPDLREEFRDGPETRDFRRDEDELEDEFELDELDEMDSDGVDEEWEERGSIRGKRFSGTGRGRIASAAG